LAPTTQGYWEGTIPCLPTDSLYSFIINQNLERPDPASRFQPNGVHGPSVVVDPSAYSWKDSSWKGLPLEEFIIYELHIGTFTPEGTFEAIINKLPYLRDTVGITAIELMPVAQCPGVRNWGYDGTYLFAPQANFGRPEELKLLIDACHAQGLAVIMDVVYNHLGPEGNYLGDYGPYFTHRYPTPWGQAINYDGPDSDPVRHFIISNALYWVTEYHIDALRLDAIHGIFDFSAKHILQELGEAVHEQAMVLGRNIHVIAESDLNDSRVITPINKGGYGLDGQWSDDFHHALHCLLTGENKGYYEDFGKLNHLSKTASCIREHIQRTDNVVMAIQEKVVPQLNSSFFPKTTIKSETEPTAIDSLHWSPSKLSNSPQQPSFFLPTSRSYSWEKNMEKPRPSSTSSVMETKDSSRQFDKEGNPNSPPLAGPTSPTPTPKPPLTSHDFNGLQKNLKNKTSCSNGIKP
jgi:malto-oligosyltrehalose trehalohydrolase